MNNPDPLFEKQLEQWARRELRGLPDVSAPAALRSRVMAAIAAREAMPWYRQAWMAWPGWAQAVALILFVSAGVALSLSMGSLLGTATVTKLATAFGYASAASGTILGFGESLASALVLVMRHTNPLIVTTVLGALFAMYMSCIGVGTIFYRMILKPARN